MIIKNFSQEEIKNCFLNIDNYLKNLEIKWIKYIDLGCKIIRLISFCDNFLPFVQKQLTFVLKDECDNFDSTLYLWNEKEFNNLASLISDKFNPKTNMRLRLETILSKKNDINISLFDEIFSKTKPIIDIQTERGFFVANNKIEEKYYYGVKNLEAEEFIKEGHIFVQFINNIVKTENSNLAHGAVIGIDGNGILMCARGQRGKSTLAVLSMIKGFEYVSDDYLILHKNNKQLLASPIYSIITLSPKMYNELYEYLSYSQFVSNNARKDKYVFNISNFHSTFKQNYPIKFCLFPEIVSDNEPSIRLCTSEEKGRAITHLIQSTLSQTQDLGDNVTIKKMYEMVKDFPFYKINLCRNIEKNTEFLKDFIKQKKYLEGITQNNERFLIDITFDLANIIDIEKGIIYSMNKFATCIYENLLRGVSKEKLQKEFSELSLSSDILESFISILSNEGILNYRIIPEEEAKINFDFIKENDYKLSFIKYLDGKNMELINNKENKNELCIK